MKFERKKSLKQRAEEAPVKMKLYKKKKKKVVIKKQTKWDRLKTWLNTELGRF